MGKWGKSTSPRKLTSRIILLQSIFTVKEYKLNKGENKLHDLGVNPLEDIGKNSLWNGIKIVCIQNEAFL